MSEQRLIDANELYNYCDMKETKDGVFIRSARIITPEFIEKLQTIDAVPVVHGHWIYNKDTGEIRCNLCNALVGMTMYSGDVEQITEVENFCFNCGAKMNGGTLCE